MAAKKETKKTEDVAPRKKRTMAPRKIEGKDFKPAEIYAWAIENQPISAADAAERFDLNPQKVKMVLFDWCAVHGKTPPRFVSRGASGGGLMKVSIQKVARKGEDGKPLKDAENKGIYDEAGVVLRVPNSVLAQISAVPDEYFQAEVDAENRTIILRPASADNEGDDDESEDDS